MFTRQCVVYHTSPHNGAHGEQSAIRPGSLVSTQLSNIIQVLESRRGGVKLPFHVALQGRDAMEIQFGNMLVEDQNNDAMSYNDCKNKGSW